MGQCPSDVSERPGLAVPVDPQAVGSALTTMAYRPVFPANLSSQSVLHEETPQRHHLILVLLDLPFGHVHQDGLRHCVPPVKPLEAAVRLSETFLGHQISVSR